MSAMLAGKRAIVTVLAVDSRFHGQRHGWETKQEVVRLAREASVKALVSVVSLENGPMIRLNNQLGASRVAYPVDDPELDEDPCWIYTLVL